MTWTKSQIREARKVPLAPILAQRGFQLHELAGDNFIVTDFADLVVKHHYWRWPSKDIQGNSIDFFTQVDGKSFADAMRILLGTNRQQPAKPKEQP
jgi:hypothetical protein